MTPGFFRKARSRKGAEIVVGSHPIKVRVQPTVTDSDGKEVTATWDSERLVIELKDQMLPAMRDSLFHEIFHAAVELLRLNDRFRGRSDSARLKAEEDIAHLVLPVLLGASDQCTGKKK